MYARALELLELEHADPQADVPERIAGMLTHCFFICGLRSAAFAGARKDVAEIVQAAEMRRRNAQERKVGFTRIVVAAQHLEQLRTREKILNGVRRSRQTLFDLG
jgi:hypothetical protein